MNGTATRGWTACAAGVLVFAATGCAALLETVAGEIGDEAGPASPLPSRTGGLDLTARHEGAPYEDEVVVTSDYQAAATIDWTLYRYGPPFSVSRSLFERAGPVGRLCRAAPIGLARGLSPWTFAQRDELGDLYGSGSATRPLAEGARSERELLDNSVTLQTIFVADDNSLGAHYIASAGRLGQQGHACSSSLFLSVWIEGDDAVAMILR